MELRIPFTTLLKVALTVLLCVCMIKLWPVILMIVVAILLAVMLDPIVVFGERHRVRRGVSVIVIAIVLITLLALFLGVTVPRMLREIGDVTTGRGRGGSPGVPAARTA